MNLKNTTKKETGGGGLIYHEKNRYINREDAETELEMNKYQQRLIRRVEGGLGPVYKIIKNNVCVFECTVRQKVSEKETGPEGKLIIGTLCRKPTHKLQKAKRNLKRAIKKETVLKF